MKKKLYRSRDNVIIGGVAAGLADYLDIDVSLVRLLWAFAAVMGGAGVIAYIIAWIVIPQEPVLPEYLETEEVDGTYEAIVGQAEEGSSPQERQKTLGIILIAIGLVFAIRRMIPGYVFSWIWPLVLIAFGVYLLFQDRRKD
ncbi:MAG: PspC domain-containing protein [Firmicutes bacterium]|nr:PspC domain-containing protein [Bacillota bacterium]